MELTYHGLYLYKIIDMIMHWCTMSLSLQVIYIYKHVYIYEVTIGLVHAYNDTIYVHNVYVVGSKRQCACTDYRNCPDRLLEFPVPVREIAQRELIWKHCSIFALSPMMKSLAYLITHTHTPHLVNEKQGYLVLHYTAVPADMQNRHLIHQQINAPSHPHRAYRKSIC